MLRVYVLERWSMLGLWWLDRGARSNQVQALMGGSVGNYLSPLQYTTKEMPVWSCGSPGGQFFVVDLAARISPWRSEVCGTGEEDQRVWSLNLLHASLWGSVASCLPVRMFPPVKIDQSLHFSSLPWFEMRRFRTRKSWCSWQYCQFQYSS